MSNYVDFSNIEDPKLRARNRGVVMANIFQDYEGEGEVITKQGAAVLFSYFKSIPNTEKALAYAEFKNAMKDRGYKYEGVEH